MKKIIIAQSVMHAIGDHDTVFKRGNITTFIAQTAEEILNLHGVHRAHIIITNLSLPLMGGVKLCSAIRTDPDLMQVSIIMTCDGAESSMTQCKQAHVNAVLPEPLDHALFFSKFSDLLLIPQRKDMRVLLRISFKGRENETPFFAASQNISISGMLFETDRALKQGDRLKCAFNIGHAEIAAECKIVREVRTASGRWQYGVEFLNLDTKSIIIIEHFVKNQTLRK